jgi:hypothetical protein
MKSYNRENTVITSFQGQNTFVLASVVANVTFSLMFPLIVIVFVRKKSFVSSGQAADFSSILSNSDFCRH